MRLDQWLWAVRVFKTRALSAEAIKSGRVEINEKAAKPGHTVRPGEVVATRMESGDAAWLRTVRVIDAPASRVGAKLVPLYAEELTPPEEFAKRSRPEFHLRSPGFRPPGLGRPTKRERRDIDDLAG